MKTLSDLYLRPEKFCTLCLHFFWRGGTDIFHSGRILLVLNLRNDGWRPNHERKSRPQNSPTSTLKWTLITADKESRHSSVKVHFRSPSFEYHLIQFKMPFPVLHSWTPATTQGNFSNLERVKHVKMGFYVKPAPLRFLSSEGQRPSKAMKNHITYVFKTKSMRMMQDMRRFPQPLLSATAVI